MAARTSSSTQAAPATASKVERSSIMSGATSPTSNVGNTDNRDAVAEELVSNQNATGARITYVGRTKATALSISPATVTLAVAETQQITPTFTPASPTIATIVYATSDATKATVSVGGLITAVATGSATITATSDDLGFTDTVVVTVS